MVYVAAPSVTFTHDRDTLCPSGVVRTNSMSVTGCLTWYLPAVQVSVRLGGSETAVMVGVVLAVEEIKTAS